MRTFRNSSKALLGVLMLAGLAACGRQDRPLPPSSPPRPTTLAPGGLHTADYRLSERPVPPRLGMM